MENALYTKQQPPRLITYMPQSQILAERLLVASMNRPSNLSHVAVRPFRGPFDYRTRPCILPYRTPSCATFACLGSFSMVVQLAAGRSARARHTRLVPQGAYRPARSSPNRVQQRTALPSSGET